MSEPRRIPVPDESCERCGSSLVLHTTASQRGGDDRYADDWYAWVGDRVTCEGCPHVTVVSGDEDGAEIATDVECSGTCCDEARHG